MVTTWVLPDGWVRQTGQRRTHCSKESVFTLDSSLDDSRMIGVRNERDDKVVLANSFLQRSLVVDV